MKKTMSFVISIMICVTLAGCGMSASLPIEEMQWKMTMIQSDGDGGTRAVGSATLLNTYPNAEHLEMTCSFDKTGFTIRNLTSGESFNGTYSNKVNGEEHTTIYDVVFANGVKGLAVSGIKEYGDGRRDGTLIISADGYALNFSAKLAGGE